MKDCFILYYRTIEDYEKGYAHACSDIGRGAKTADDALKVMQEKTSLSDENIFMLKTFDDSFVGSVIDEKKEVA